jgi:hypothetical protein
MVILKYALTKIKRQKIWKEPRNPSRHIKI